MQIDYASIPVMRVRPYLLDVELHSAAQKDDFSVLLAHTKAVVVLEYLVGRAVVTHVLFAPGSHAFRRFRNTYPKNETDCPKGLRDYWLGHAGNSMEDLYDMVKDNAAFRRKKAAEYGVGFELPASVSVVPNVPKKRLKAKRAKAA